MKRIIGSIVCLVAATSCVACVNTSAQKVHNSLERHQCYHQAAIEVEKEVDRDCLTSPSIEECAAFLGLYQKLEARLKECDDSASD